MAEALKLKAHAKINLRLEVTGKRKDGYHLLRMVNTLVSLHDEVSLTLNRSGKIEVSCSHPQVPAGEENIAHRAAKAILERAGDPGAGAHITIRKRIPVAAGLGGGSSDAAMVVVGLCSLLDIDIPARELKEIALKLGADVPFFISGRPALVTGIGEEIEFIGNFPDWSYVLVTPDFQVSTAWAYKKFRMKRKKQALSRDEILGSLIKEKIEKDFFLNDLEAPVVKKYPVINDLKKELLGLGAFASVMSGSGPTVVGVFEDKKKAGEAKLSINKNHPKYFCESVSSVATSSK